MTLPYGLLAGASFTRMIRKILKIVSPPILSAAMRDNTGLFAQDTMALASAHPHSRADALTKTRQYGDTANPRVQGMVEATDWLSFTASAGRSFRAPTIDEAHLDPTLNPEKAWTYEAGFVTHESSRTFKANYFRANVGDEIQSSSFTADNVGHRRVGRDLRFKSITR